MRLLGGRWKHPLRRPVRDTMFIGRSSPDAISPGPSAQSERHETKDQVPKPGCHQKPVAACILRALNNFSGVRWVTGCCPTRHQIGHEAMYVEQAHDDENQPAQCADTKDDLRESSHAVDPSNVRAQRPAKPDR